MGPAAGSWGGHGPGSFAVRGQQHSYQALHALGWDARGSEPRASRWRACGPWIFGALPGRVTLQRGGMGGGKRLAGGVGVVDLPARGLADVSARVDDRNPVCRVDLAQVEGVQCCLLLVGDRPSASSGATTMTPAKVGSRFTARISSTNRVEPRMQTISGRSGTARRFGRRKVRGWHCISVDRPVSRRLVPSRSHSSCVSCRSACGSSCRTGSPGRRRGRRS